VEFGLKFDRFEEILTLLLLLGCQHPQLRVQSSKLLANFLPERGHLFRKTLLSFRDAWKIQQTYIR
jgi:hypothetical protein